MKDWCRSSIARIMTDYQPNVQRWVAAAMTTGRGDEAVQRKRVKAINKVIKRAVPGNMLTLHR